MDKIKEIRIMIAETKCHKERLLGKQKHYVLLGRPKDAQEYSALINEADMKIIQLYNSIELLTDGQNNIQLQLEQ